MHPCTSFRAAEASSHDTTCHGTHAKQRTRLVYARHESARAEIHPSSQTYKATAVGGVRLFSLANRVELGNRQERSNGGTVPERSNIKKVRAGSGNVAWSCSLQNDAILCGATSGCSRSVWRCMMVGYEGTLCDIVRDIVEPTPR